MENRKTFYVDTSTGNVSTRPAFEGTCELIISNDPDNKGGVHRGTFDSFDEALKEFDSIIHIQQSAHIKLPDGSLWPDDYQCNEIKDMDPVFHHEPSHEILEFLTNKIHPTEDGLDE